MRGVSVHFILELRMALKSCVESLLIFFAVRVTALLENLGPLQQLTQSVLKERFKQIIVHLI